MSAAIRVEKVEDSGAAAESGRDPWRAVLGSSSGLGPWIEALRPYFGEELPPLAAVEEFLSALQKAEPSDPYSEAAELAHEHAEKVGTSLALLGAFYRLKTRSIEVGRSPAGHWKLNRLLNAGSRAIDFMLGSDHFRGLCMKTLLYRMLNSAVGRASVEKGGVVKELSCGVRWDATEERVLRRELPPEAPTDAELSEEVVDWLLEELLSRGLSSMVLGSVIEESREGRRYTLGEEVAKRISELPADEGRLLAGAVFMPARLGGWDLSTSEKLLDAFAVAQEITDDFAPDQTKVEVYRDHLGWVEKRRRIPTGLSATWEVNDGEEIWSGRWGMIVHPPRRTLHGGQGFSALELGFYFDEDQKGIRRWSGRQKRKVSQRLREIVIEEDDQVFSIFAKALDEVVEGINSQPGTMIGGSSKGAKALGQPSPLWAGLGGGVEELREVLRDGTRKDLAAALRRWTVEVKDV